MRVKLRNLHLTDNEKFIFMDDLKVLETNTYPLKGSNIYQSLYEGDIRKSINTLNIVLHGTDYPRI